MIVDAPEMRAPCTALRPSGPQPTTATVEPGRRMPVPCDVVAPRPATATQLHTMPRSTAGALVKTGTTHSSKRDHHLGEPADVRVGVDRRAVAHVGHRHQIVRALAAEELAHVAAAAQALVAGAALRRARHAHAVAHLHAPHLGAHGLDDADAAVALDERHRVEAAEAAARGRRCRSGRGPGLRCRGGRRSARARAEDRAAGRARRRCSSSRGSSPRCGRAPGGRRSAAA